ncbi:hypothetical protein [Streptomyces sp. NPDC051364]|uniref:hypothetical protein n=1 Tax=Streptomyces sp. NPDC051364 TaxID=3155799 RepID=UPI003417E938
MTTTTWITGIALIMIVFRQLREGRLTLKSYLLPLGIVTFVGFSHLHTVPRGGNDLVLIGAAASSRPTFSRNTWQSQLGQQAGQRQVSGLGEASTQRYGV